MWNCFQRRILLPVFGLVLLLSPAGAAAADSLTWNTNANRVSADIQSVDLVRLLEGVSQASGWQIYLESNSTYNVSAKFTDLTPGAALRQLLGNLSFALVPETNSRSRLYVFHSSQKNATRLIRPADLNSRAAGRKIVPNELLVRVKPGTDIEALARALGAKIVGRMDGLNIYRLQFADEAAADAALLKLKANPDVVEVEHNYVFDPPSSPQMLANAPVGPVSLALNPPSKDDPCSATIGLIDTRVQSLGGQLDPFLLKSISITDDAPADSSVPSHGTAMAETILRAIAQAGGGSSSVQILPVDVYGASETTTSWNVALGVQAAVNQGAKVLNLSLGGTSDSAVLNDVIQQALAKGIVIFAAAGNQPVSTPTYPAALPGVHAVTATQQGKIAPYANFGSFVSMALPGASVVYLNGQAYVVQGTSPATAYATGVAAGTRGQNCWPWAQIESAMQQKFPVPK